MEVLISRFALYFQNIDQPLTVTHPTPVSFALLMATSMAKWLAVAPRVLLASTQAVDALSFRILGSLFGWQDPLKMSFMYISENAKINR